MCLVYKMHLSSVILLASTHRLSESHFINNLNEICSDARIWQRCARTRCDFRRKGSVWCGVNSDHGVAVSLMHRLQADGQEGKHIIKNQPKISYVFWKSSNILIKFLSLGIAGLQKWTI